MIINIVTKTSLIVEVENLKVIENIESNFDCFSRPDISNECVLDLTCIDGEEEHNQLCEILSIKPDSDQAIELSGGGYTVFFC